MEQKDDVLVAFVAELPFADSVAVAETAAAVVIAVGGRQLFQRDASVVVPLGSMPEGNVVAVVHVVVVAAAYVAAAELVFVVVTSPGVDVSYLMRSLPEKTTEFEKLSREMISSAQRFEVADVPWGEPVVQILFVDS